MIIFTTPTTLIIGLTNNICLNHIYVVFASAYKFSFGNLERGSRIFEIEDKLGTGELKADRPHSV